MSSSKRLTRRNFLAGTAVGGATLLVAGSRVFGANERVPVGVIGCGGRGGAHVGWAEKSGGQVVAVCDPDVGRMGSAANKAGGNPKQYRDLRKLLDDKSVDAVAIAMPNHWHALGTIMACEAGKDVYCEKPASHSIWEGRKMVEAARKYKRIVQIGTQQRSDPAFLTLRDKIRKRELGELQWVHSLWYAHRGPIGNVDGPQTPPDNVDYSLWCGPRYMVPLRRKRFHYDWHWFWEYGNGDMGNRVIHTIDDVHHVLDIGEDVPVEMMGAGGRFKYDDDATTPNTEIIVMKWKVPIIFGSRNLPYVDEKGNKKGTSVYRRFGRGFRFTNLIKCENGFFAVSRGGGAVYDNDGKQTEKIKGDGGSGHMRNWLDAVKSRKVEDLRADVLGGHLSSVMLHTGNISCRIGRRVDAGQVTEAVDGIEEAEETWKQTVDHLKRNGVDLEKERPTLGPWLTFDPKTERFTGESAEIANLLVKEPYRPPFTIEGRV